MNLLVGSGCKEGSMGITKTEVNLKRLIAAAPSQHNPSKLVHYVATLREMLEQLSFETTPQGLPRVSKALLNDYSEKIESIASKLAAAAPPSPSEEESEEQFDGTLFKESPSSKKEQEEKLHSASSSPSSILRRRFVNSSSADSRNRDATEVDDCAPVKLDAGAQLHIEKHRKLQEDLTDEMVVLARQLKESSLMMNHSIENTEKILDSTEEAIEHSLASTGHANTRATQIYTESSKTTCFTWLAIFVMTCIFVMVVLLIRVT